VIRPAASRLVAALLGLAALLPGCRRDAPPPRVETIRIAGGSLAAAAEVGLDQAAVEGLARTALAEAGFAAAPGDGPSYRLVVELGSLRLGPGAGGQGLMACVSVNLDLGPTKGGGAEPGRRERGAGTARVGADGPGPAVRQALAQALGEAARGLRIGLSADAKPVAALLADLDSPDRRVRERAAEALGERRDPAAVPALLKRLGDGDAQVVHKTVGALARIRDQRAVTALIDLARDGDPAITLRMVAIVGDIGGPDAQGWLLTMEQAHPDPRVRAAATEALATLQRAAAETTAGAAPPPR